MSWLCSSRIPGTEQAIGRRIAKTAGEVIGAIDFKDIDAASP
jgi:hypothetical protein